MTDNISLKNYRDIFTAYSRPSDMQIDGFVKYVSASHSWYKHLPLKDPGATFTFFLDPHAGMDRLVYDDGHILFRDRNSQSETFHYNQLPTKAYRNKYGHLNFSCERGTSIIGCVDTELGVAMLDNNHILPILVIGQTIMLPPIEILKAGSINLTRTIHHRVDSRLISINNKTSEEETKRMIEESRNEQHLMMKECISRVCDIAFSKS